MPRTEIEVKKIAEDYKKILNNVFEDVEIYLFGSYCKGTPNKWSDIDLAIVSPDFAHIEYITAIKILNKMRYQVSLEISAIPFSPKDLIIAPPLGTIEYDIYKTAKKIA